MGDAVTPYVEICETSQPQASIIDRDLLRKCEDVKERMAGKLGDEQIRQLSDVLVDVFIGEDMLWASNDNHIAMFLEAKAIEGCTGKTLEYYAQTLRKFSGRISKPVAKVTAMDIRDYISYLLNDRGVSEVTANNERRNLSSFFQWLHDEDIITRNPVKAVRAVRAPKVVKKPFSDTELEMIREACGTDRERAIVELLDSSGMRVGELVGLKLSNVDIERRECLVFGKGRKERMCYMSDVAAMYLTRYLKSRNDDSPYLIAPEHPKQGHESLSEGAVGSIVRKIGERAGVEKCHPHRFRRTMATRNLKRGMPLEEIKELLGHENVETTLIYAKTDSDAIKSSARRLMG